MSDDSEKTGVKLTLIRPDEEFTNAPDGMTWTRKKAEDKELAGVIFAYTHPSGKREEAKLTFEDLHVLIKIARMFGPEDLDALFCMVKERSYPESDRLFIRPLTQGDTNE
jgi:hypothetical protein